MIDEKAMYPESHKKFIYKAVSPSTFGEGSGFPLLVNLNSQPDGQMVRWSDGQTVR